MSNSAEVAHPIAALLVSTWYPSISDPGRGRFVADQAEALARSGLVRPLVASFDPARVLEAAGVRHVGTVTDHLRGALASRTDAVSPGGWSAPASVGTARLPVPESSGRAPLEPGRDAEDRRAALELLADRLDPAGMSGVVHAHTAYPDGYAAVGAARRLGWPLVITEHASFVARQLRNPEHRWRYIEAVNAASRIIAVSDTLASELTESVPEIGDKLVVIPNVIAVDDFAPAPGPQQRNPDELIFVGDRKERKGMVVLLRAFADVLQHRPSATLRLIGSSPTAEEEQRWHELATDLGVAGAVRFEGPADRAGVAAALRRASVFVHASPRETFGVVTLEALAAGLPVVATESGGISAILKDSRLGALVPPQDRRMLARAVLRTLERRDEFDPETLRSAVESFSGPSVAPRLASLYEEVIAGAGVAAARPSAAGRGVNWAGRLEPLDEPLVVLASDTERAARALSRLPSELLGRITLVTHGDVGSEELPLGIGRLVLTRTHVTDELRRRGIGRTRGRLVDRLMRLARDPVGLVRHRLVKGGRAELRWRAHAGGIGRALGEITSGARAGGMKPEVVCLDVLDYAAVGPAVAAGAVRAAPGGFVWLADRWAATQGGGRPPTAATASAEPDAISASTAG